MTAIARVQRGVAVLRSQSRSLHDALRLLEAPVERTALEPQVLVDLLALGAELTQQGRWAAARATVALALKQQLTDDDRALVEKRLERLPPGPEDLGGAATFAKEAAAKHANATALLGDAAVASVSGGPKPEGDRLAAFEALFWRGGALTALAQSFDHDEWKVVADGFAFMLELVGDEGILRELASLLFTSEQPRGAWAVCDTAVRLFPESVDCRVQRVILGMKTGRGTPELAHVDLQWVLEHAGADDERRATAKELLVLLGQSLQKRPPMA